MTKSSSKGVVAEAAENEEIEWEVRPGGMLVQKRDDDGTGSSGPMIKIKVSHGSSQHEINVPAQATFGDLKRLLARETGLEPKEQRLLFRGKEKEDEECLHMVGIKDMSKVVLLEDPASKEKKLEQMKTEDHMKTDDHVKMDDHMKMDPHVAKACEAVVTVRSEVDKLAEKVSDLETAVISGNKVADKEFIVLAEFLMVQLLKLDGIEAEGEARAQRRMEVRRVQSLVETVDILKARNSNPFSNSSNNSNAVSVATKWETFEGGMGSLSAPPPVPSSSQLTKDWEQFD